MSFNSFKKHKEDIRISLNIFLWIYLLTWRMKLAFQNFFIMLIKKHSNSMLFSISGSIKQCAFSVGILFLILFTAVSLEYHGVNVKKFLVTDSEAALVYTLIPVSSYLPVRKQLWLCLCLVFKYLSAPL